MYLNKTFNIFVMAKNESLVKNCLLAKFLQRNYRDKQEF